MSATTIGVPPLQAVMIEDGKVGIEAHKSLLRVYNMSPLIPISTGGGPASFQVPYAKLNQGQRRTYKKISPDTNVPTLMPSGEDLIEFGASLAMGTVQGSKITIQSDGVSNWYVVA